MKNEFSDLSELLQYSTPAEGFWAQLPETVQAKAMAQQGSIRSLRQLREFAAGCSEERS